MTPRHIALVAGAVLVLGLGVYLYVAVQSTSSAGATVSPAPNASREDRAPVREEPRTQTPARRPPQDHRSTAPEVARPTESSGSSELGKDAVMAAANRAYDVGDFDEAMVIAKRVLADDPKNVRMLRIMVSASCILGDTSTAQTNYRLLDPGGKDRADMRRRCDQYGIAFTET